MEKSDEFWDSLDNKIKEEQGWTEENGALYEEFGAYDLREMAIWGYEQAEKDHTLTWQDIKRIIKIADDMIHEYSHDALVAMGEQEYHEEVLRRYNNIK